MRNTGLSYLILYYDIQVSIAKPLSVTFNASFTVDKLHTLQLHYIAQQLVMASNSFSLSSCL